MKTQARVAKVKLEELADAAHAVIVNIPLGKPCLENLSAGSQALVGIAYMNPGICSACKWTSGASTAMEGRLCGII